MGICILSAEERGRLIHYKLAPVCTQHRHCNTKSAIAKIESGQYELVTDPTTGIQHIWQPPMHYLHPKKSGGVGVVQRVVMAQPINIQPIEFGDDTGAPLKLQLPAGLSIERILRREVEFRTEQLANSGSAIRANNAREKRK